MNETVDLNRMRDFIAVAEAGSFTGAAKRLGAPRASISRRIADLERNLGVRLFHRTTRRVSLSTAGEVLFQSIGGAVATIDDALQALPEVDASPAGRLRLTAPVDLASALLPQVIQDFTDAHPEISVEVSVTNTFVDLVAGGFDCALRVSARKLADSSLVARKLGELPLGIFASPAYLSGAPKVRRPADLAKHRWVTMGPRRRVRLTRGGRDEVVEVRGRIDTDDMVYRHQAVLRGGGIGTLPLHLTRESVAEGRLVRLLPRWTAAKGKLWILWPGGRHVPLKTRAFADAVAAALT